LNSSSAARSGPSLTWNHRPVLGSCGTLFLLC